MAKKLDESTERALAALMGVSTLLDGFRLRAWDEAQLTVTQLRLLTLLEQKEGVGNAELADKLMVTRPSVSALLDRLEKGGFLRREISPEDRRGIRIWLEPRGREAVTKLQNDGVQYAAEVLGKLSEKDRLTFARAAERVATAAKNLREEALAAEADKKG